MSGSDKLNLEGPYGKGKGPFGITLEEISAKARNDRIVVKILNVLLSTYINFLTVFNCRNT